MKSTAIALAIGPIITIGIIMSVYATRIKEQDDHLRRQIAEIQVSLIALEHRTSPVEEPFPLPFR